MTVGQQLQGEGIFTNEWKI